MGKEPSLGPEFNSHHPYQTLSELVCAYDPSAGVEAGAGGGGAKTKGFLDFFGQTVYLNLQSPGTVNDPVLPNKV